MERKVTIEGQITSSINFAMQQNYVPVIRALTIKNESAEELSNLQLRISFEPEFAKEYTYDINSIRGGESVEVSPVRIRLSTEFLFSLTEKIVGSISVSLYEREEQIYSHDESIELLAYDEWSGLRIMPEIISAFVTPNHPKVAEVLTQASYYLDQWTKHPAFTGYQTQNPNNVKIQMAAIYAAIETIGIIYNNPPASFEATGQRVRLSHTVIEQKQGTCLDLTVLAASCFEAAGLHPLIVFQRGHAFAGCWLEEETFADCVVDDISALEKRMAEGTEQILLLECTDLTAGKHITFDNALKHGRNHLLEASQFIYAVDIRRSRGSGIRPIPVRLDQAGTIENDEIEFNRERIQGPEKLTTINMRDLSESDSNVTRQRIWERKLLDFSLRNALLNFRANKNSLQLMTADLAELEDRLSDGKDFALLEIPAEWTASIRDAKIYEIENDKDLIENIASEEFKNNRIRTFLPAEELQLHLKAMYRSAKVSMEENGTNTMFLALGFLRWYETDLSEKPRYAPLVLIPIDIVKSPRNRGYIIRSRQEDAQINITMLEYLRQIFDIKINGLDPLPEDDRGVDLPLIFHTIRQAIMGKSKWNIENMAFIGLFSFGQFVMWNDIRNRSNELKENKVVSSLIDGKMNWMPEPMQVTLENLDKTVAPDAMAVPLNADSSQMVAISVAAKGQSFVLHGPPGTGKSQTITNMIANALYQGKSVLFVAEKMAALSVVQNRLAGIGLDPFCLELHSNKTNKTAVLGELDKALEVGRIKEPGEYKATADRILGLRKNLNSVIEAIHCIRDYGCSFYDAIEKLEKNIAQKGKVKFTIPADKQVTKELIDEYQYVLRTYTVASKVTGPYKEAAFRGYEGTTYSMELRDELQKSLREATTQAVLAGDSAKRLLEWVNLPENCSKQTLNELCSVDSIIQNPAGIMSKILFAEYNKDIFAQISAIYQAGCEYAALIHEADSAFEKQIYTYNAGEAHLKYKQAASSWFLPKAIGTSKLLKELRLYAKAPSSIVKEALPDIYMKLMRIAELKEQLGQVSPELAKYMGELYLGTATNWTTFGNVLNKTIAIQNAVSIMKSDKRSRFLNALCNPEDVQEKHNDIQVLQSFMNQLDSLNKIYGIRLENESNNWIIDVYETLNRYLGNLEELKAWVILRQNTGTMRNEGLGAFVDAWEKGEVDSNDIISAFEASLYYLLVLRTINEDEQLKSFQGRQYEDMIVQYAELIDKYRKLTIQELVARLSANVPVTGTANAASSEIGILKKAIKSNGRMMSIRKLFDQIPTLLRKLCPCMLMSPISVAQYIDPSFPKFDLVIFDEASQLPTSEAVGTIARGENVVVVGDPKQLPPTNFFNTNITDEENAEKEDLESLLDDCLAISMPQEYLKWHYRSRHESLIAYSNMKYYDNKLYTFPSPNDLISEVKLVQIEGCYDKGKTKQNKAEAEAVINEIIRRLQDDELKNESIGVVTFSSVQQNLIDDMLTDAFAKYPELYEQDKQSKEPVFIKNLENVQGDERDIILFSVGYGPNQDGKVSMNFGPLNRDGGWRRLNVAISRARKKMIVYSTLRAEQIDLSRTRAEGVSGLKGFLEYAARGKSALIGRANNVTKPVDVLIDEIANSIRTMGYDTKCNIGCSEYKMDIGVVDKENKDTYVLGILLDGHNCYAAATSKDRFVSQPGVLKGLGWNIMRIWTLEWLDTPEKVLKEIEKAIIDAQNKPKTAASANTKAKEKIVFEKMNPDELESITSCGTDYRTSDIRVVGPADAFYQPYTQNSIRKIISDIIEKEAPVSRKSLMRRVLSAWSISRAGTNVEDIFDNALRAVKPQATKDKEMVFYWKTSQNPAEHNGYRVFDQNQDKRSMEDIPSQEITNAIVEVLNEQVSLSRTDLIRETAKKFGFTRIGTTIEDTVAFAIDKAALNKVIKINDDKVMLI